MRVAIARFRSVPPEFHDDELLAKSLRERGAEAELVAWDEEEVDWWDFDLVVVRSTWDYVQRREEFLAWADSVGDRLRNPPEVLRWNSDKRYLADLEATALPVVPTRFVEPGDAMPELEGEVVVKPAISAGGRDTGRFGPAKHEEARALVGRITAEGRTAMVQPYLGSVDERGEAALVFIGDEESHVLHKRAVLRPDEEAPVRDDALGAAEAMYDPGLVRAGTAGPAEHELAAAVIDQIRARFGRPPLYARVDLVHGLADDPVLMELELIEPNLYLSESPGSAARLTEAILRGG